MYDYWPRTLLILFEVHSLTKKAVKARAKTSAACVGDDGAIYDVSRPNLANIMPRGCRDAQNVVDVHRTTLGMGRFVQHTPPSARGGYANEVTSRSPIRC